MTNTKNMSLEKELMTTLKELNNSEQNEIKIFSSYFINSCENLKKEKLQSIENSISNQIKFYGKRKEQYLKEINSILAKYSTLIEEVINLYTTRFTAIITKLQNCYDNQKVSIVNCKISIYSKNDVKEAASEYKINNYETIIQECKKQLLNCKKDMEVEVNQIFYNTENSLIVKKANIFQKFINLFTGGSKVKNFVLNSSNAELQKIERNSTITNNKIYDTTIDNIALIEDGIIQTKNIFDNMLKEYGYNG